MMERNRTLISSWVGLSESGHPIRVEEHCVDLGYFVEFYDADRPDSNRCLEHCPRSGSELDVSGLRNRKLEQSMTQLQA
jgi:hypothetical protein